MRAFPANLLFLTAYSFKRGSTVIAIAGVLDYSEGTGRDILRTQLEKKVTETVSSPVTSALLPSNPAPGPTPS